MSERKSRFDSIVDNLVSQAIWVLLALVGGGLWGVSQAGGVWFWIGIGLLAACLAFTVFVFWRRDSWGSRKANKHAAVLRRQLKRVHPGVRPVLAYIAKESASNLAAPRGEVVSLRKYMCLMEESIGFGKLIDVTFLAKTHPSSWGTRQQADDLVHSVWEYFDAQKEIKRERGAAIRIRRILLVPDSVTAEPSEQTALANLKLEHQQANIDLIHLSPALMPDVLEQDLGVFIGSDKRAWIISSDYDDSRKAVGVVNAQVKHDESAMNQALPELFTKIRAVYRETATPGSCYFGRLLATAANADNSPVHGLIQGLNY